MQGSLELCVERSRVLGLAGGREERAGSVQHLPLFGDARVERLGPQRAAGEARVVAMDERRASFSLSKVGLTWPRSCAKVWKTSALFFSTHRLIESRFASDENASNSSTPAAVVAAPSKAVLITFCIIT